MSSSDWMKVTIRYNPKRRLWSVGSDEHGIEGQGGTLGVARKRFLRNVARETKEGWTPKSR